jgi:TonB-linked SusC/RagA family outer membrane protein
MKKITILILLLCWSGFAFGQSKVAGKVVRAEDKTAMPGATVRVVGTDNLVVTGTDGDFIIPCTGNSVRIAVTFAGFKTVETTVAVPQQSPMIIYMEPAQQALHEVVISTGYQEIAKERSTGSFSKIDNATFNQQVTTDVISRLESIASSVDVDRKSTNPGVSVRGLSTIQGISGPLIILDNFPYDGDITNINPNDVESITILKDAAAASIWGTKAGNGVIVITTKKGKFNQPLSVDFNANLSYGPKPDLNYFKTMTSADVISVEKMLFSQGFYDAATTDPSHPVLSPVAELLLAEQNGSISAADADQQINAMSQVDSRKQFEKYIYRNLFNQQYALSLHGGSAQYSWLASGGWDKNVGNLDEGFNRMNLHFQNRIRPIKNLELTGEIWYTQSNALTGRQPFGSLAYPSYPYLQLADEQGNALPVAHEYSLSYLNSIDNGKLLDWKYYPLTDYKYDRTSTQTQDVMINFGVNYRIFPGLTADFKYRYERNPVNVLADHTINSFYARDMINSYTSIDDEGNVTNNIPVGGIQDYTQSTAVTNNERGQLSYDKEWGKNSITAIAGGEIRDERTDGTAFRLYGVNANNYSTGTVDYNTFFPNYINGFPNNIPYVDGLTGLDSRFVSVFSNAAYTYDQRYTVSLSGRRDASNLFGVNTNNKWTPLWSGGGAWNISKENFYKSDWLPYLRLRGSYGYSGNVNPTQSGVTIISILGNSIYTNTPFARILSYANPDLRWEKVGTANLGLDFRTKDDRLSGSIEYYHKTGKDLFGPALIDYTTGIGATATRNIASMEGSGFDIELNSINTTGAVKWTTNLLFSTNHDKITSYNADQSIGSNFVGGSGIVTISGVVGWPVYSILSYKWAGLDPQTGDPRGYVNGQVSKDYASILSSGTPASDLVYSGSALPTIFGSLGNTVTWKQLSLTARVLYKFGYYFRRPALDYGALFNNDISNAEFSKRWQQPGDETKTNVPSMVYPDNPQRDQFYTGSQVNVDKGDNVRLQYVTFSYQLLPAQLRKLPFKQLSFYVTGNNLGIIWRANKDGIDPDYPVGTLPQARIYSIGFKGSF